MTWPREFPAATIFQSGSIRFGANLSEVGNFLLLFCQQQKRLLSPANNLTIAERSEAPPPTTNNSHNCPPGSLLLIGRRLANGVDCTRPKMKPERLSRSVGRRAGQSRSNGEEAEASRTTSSETFSSSARRNVQNAWCKVACQSTDCQSIGDFRCQSISMIASVAWA